MGNNCILVLNQNSKLLLFNFDQNEIDPNQIIWTLRCVEPDLRLKIHNIHTYIPYMPVFSITLNWCFYDIDGNWKSEIVYNEGKPKSPLTSIYLVYSTFYFIFYLRMNTYFTDATHHGRCLLMVAPWLIQSCHSVIQSLFLLVHCFPFGFMQLRISSWSLPVAMALIWC